MKRFSRKAVLAGTLLLAALLVAIPAYGATQTQTLTKSWERAMVRWQYVSADGFDTVVQVHQCEHRIVDSTAKPGKGFSSSGDCHLMVDVWATKPGSVEAKNAHYHVVGSSLSLGTGLRGARLHGNGLGTYTETDGMGTVIVERDATFLVELRLLGTGPITINTWDFTSAPDIYNMAWRTQITQYTRAATVSGKVQMDGTSIIGTAAPVFCELLHEDTVSTLLP